MRNCVQYSTFFHHDRDLCVGLFYSNEQASIWPSLAHGQILTLADIKLRFFFFATTSICVVALELPRLVTPDVPTMSHTWKRCYCFLNPITSPIFRVVSCHDLLSRDGVICTHFHQKPKNFRIVLRRVQVRRHGYQRPWHSSTESEKRGACVLSCKPRGSHPHETAWVSCGDCSYRR